MYTAEKGRIIFPNILYSKVLISWPGWSAYTGSRTPGVEFAHTQYRSSFVWVRNASPLPSTLTSITPQTTTIHPCYVYLLTLTPVQPLIIIITLPSIH